MKSKQTSLESVDIQVLERPDTSIGDLTEKENLIRLIGRQEAFGALATMTSLMWAENLHRIKQSAVYKKIGMDWKDVVRLGTPFSLDTADRMVANFREFGTAFFQLRDIVRITAQAYRELNPAIENGNIIIGDDTIPLKKEFAGQIQAAIESYRSRVESQSEDLTRTKADAKKAKQELGLARKAADQARQELIDAKRVEENLYELANPREKLLLRAQAHISMACAQMTTVKNDPETTDADLVKMRGLCHYAMKIITGTSGEDPEGLFADMLEPRDLISEYVQEAKGKKG